MNISSVYNTYHIPKNLQKHMLRVAAVGKYLASNISTAVNINAITSVLLLHDLGNLLKFDLSKGVGLFDKSESDLDHWKHIKNEMHRKYSDEHEATIGMAREIGVENRILFLLSNVGSANLGKTLVSTDFELKICSYSDFRVTPSGFATVTERFEDIIDRYNDTDHVLADEEATRLKMQQCLQLEDQLQSILTVNLQEIPRRELEEESELLRMYEV